MQSTPAAEALSGPAEAVSETDGLHSSEASAALLDTSSSKAAVLQQVEHIVRMTCLQLQLDDTSKARIAMAKLSGSKVREELGAYWLMQKQTNALAESV